MIFKKKVPSKDDPKVTKQYLKPCSPGRKDAIEMTWMEVKSDELYEPKLKLAHFEKAIQISRPTVNADDIKQHVKFTLDFGQEG